MLIERVSIEEYIREDDFLPEDPEAAPVVEAPSGCCLSFPWGTTVVPEGVDADDVPF